MDKPNPQDLLAALLAAAKAAGADAADALFVESTSSSVSYRLGRLEEVQRAESFDLGLRVFAGQKVAFVSTTDLSADALAALPERALTMAKLAPEDPYACLAPEDRLAKDWPDLDLADPSEPSADFLSARARDVEAAALAVGGVTNSEGGSAGFSGSAVALAASSGFYGSYAATRHFLGASAIAGEGADMQTDYDYVSARHLGDLEDTQTVGTRAGMRAVARLSPRKVASQALPVVYAPRVANGLISHLVQAISGTAIARGVSFLKDRLGTDVFAPSVAVIDDPLRPRGLRSRPFDGEGIMGEMRSVIEDGVLKTWLLDCASAKKLGLRSTGHGARGTAGPPGPSASNIYMRPGTLPPEALIADIQQGFYVTELMGMGVNAVTGDYSRGASGFFIENGNLAYPVAEVTIAGNLKDMFRQLTPADDLQFRYGIDAPTCRIEGMTLAGA